MQRARQHARVDAPDAVEPPVDPAGEPTIRVPRPQEPGAHHRREGQRYNPRDDDGAGERERELAEERTGQPTLDANRCIHRRQRDRHRDDRAGQLAGGVDGGPVRGFPFVQVPFDVLHHHDRVVDDETDGQDDGEQREEIYGKAGDEHEEHAADE